MTFIRKPLAPLVLALSAAALASTLSACAPLVIGGAAMGMFATIDRRTSGAQIEDESIELRGGSRLRDAYGDKAHINITSYNRQVLLTGEVPNEQARTGAEQIISRVDNVKGIVNDLAVLPPSSLGQRSNDALITGKVKASLVDDKELYAGAFKVVTERSVVYLMGRVTQREADKASQIARTVSGVQRVVKIFEYLSEEDLRRLGQGQAPAPVTPATPVAPQAVPAVAPVAPAPAATTSPTTGSSVTPTPLPPATK